MMLAYELKHFVADILFQNEYMVHGKSKENFKDYFLPLLAHSFINAILAAFIALLVGKGLMIFLVIFVAELFFHFVIDRLKASPKLLGKWTPDNPIFWQVLGLDQFLHRICYILYIFVLCN